MSGLVAMEPVRRLLYRPMDNTLLADFILQHVVVQSVQFTLLRSYSIVDEY